MMTDKQRQRFFFPAWNACCRSLGWKMIDSRLITGDVAALNQHAQRVVAVATAMAARTHRAPVLDDLRHAVYVIVLGRDKDTLKLSNGEVDKIVSFFKLMVEETNLEADIRLNHPAIAEREALVVKIQRLKVPFAVIDQVCRRSYAPVYTAPHWDQLPLPNIRALLGVLTEMKAEYERDFLATDAHK
jgi:hypothetical protein